MSSFTDPMKDISASLALMSDPLKEHREMMASIADPLKEYRKMMASITDPLKEHREMMASITDPLKEHREMMDSITNPLKEYREMMANFTDPMKEFRASLELLSNPVNGIQKTITNIASLKALKKVALDVQPNIDIDGGMVSLATKRVAASEIQEITDEIFHNSTSTESNSLEESINNLVDEIKAQHNPLMQQIITFFIYPLIVGIIISVLSPIVDHHIEPYLKSEKTALVKELKANIGSEIKDRELLSTLRYVTADSLNVRASPSAKSKTIGHLSFSAIVLIIERQKSWTLIEWRDTKTGVQITGWVFSRYLAKFR